MTDELKFPEQSNRDALAEPLVRLLRDAYAPPGAEAYWHGLEQRILARTSVANFATADGQWWSVLGGWAQAGLVAAAAIFALAGALNQRFNASESQFVYESVLQQNTPEVLSAPTDLLAAPEGSRSDATLIYVLSH